MRSANDESGSPDSLLSQWPPGNESQSDDHDPKDWLAISEGDVGNVDEAPMSVHETRDLLRRNGIFIGASEAARHCEVMITIAKAIIDDERGPTVSERRDSQRDSEYSRIIQYGGRYNSLN